MKDFSLYFSPTVAERDEALGPRVRAVCAVYGVQCSVPSPGRLSKHSLREAASRSAALFVVTKAGAPRFEAREFTSVAVSDRKPTLVLLEEGINEDLVRAKLAGHKSRTCVNRFRLKFSKTDLGMDAKTLDRSIRWLNLGAEGRTVLQSVVLVAHGLLVLSRAAAA